MLMSERPDEQGVGIAFCCELSNYRSLNQSCVKRSQKVPSAYPVSESDESLDGNQSMKSLWARNILLWFTPKLGSSRTSLHQPMLS